MKYLGQYIQQFISRFRNDVFLEDVSSGTIASGGNLGLDSNNKIVKANVPTTHDAVTLAGSLDYITLSGQEITRNAIDLAADITGTLSVGNGGTGATSLSSNSILTGNGSSAITAELNFTYDGSNVILQSSTANKPDFTLVNTSSGSTSSLLNFVKDKGAAGADNDNIGFITFTSDNDAQEQHNFAQFQALVATARDANEKGGVKLTVSAITGGSGTVDANVLTGTATGSSVVDVTLGDGATSETTIAGTLTMGSTAFVNNSGVIQVATQGTIDHDSLANFVAAEHYRWDTDISSTATINAANIPTLNQNTTGNAATATNLVASTSTAVQLGTIELGHASDTTIARSAAGKVTIEGANVQTTQICCTHHNMSLDGGSSTVDYYFPINSLADGSSSGLYYTRVLAAYDGKIVKIILRGNSLSGNTFGTNCTIYMSRRDHDNASYYHQSSGFQASETFNLSTQTTVVVPCGVGGANASDWVFEEGDMLGFSVVKDTTATDIDLTATIVWEYTV